MPSSNCKVQANVRRAESRTLSNSPRTPAISRDEIQAVYLKGEDAVIALVEGLLARIVVLEERVEKLENQQSKQSGNSSKPPSSNGFKPKPKSLRSKSKRRSGGQKGQGLSTELCKSNTKLGRFNVFQGFEPS